MKTKNDELKSTINRYKKFSTSKVMAPVEDTVISIEDSELDTEYLSFDDEIQESSKSRERDLKTTSSQGKVSFQIIRQSTVKENNLSK